MTARPILLAARALRWTERHFDTPFGNAALFYTLGAVTVLCAVCAKAVLL